MHAYFGSHILRNNNNNNNNEHIDYPITMPQLNFSSRDLTNNIHIDFTSLYRTITGMQRVVSAQ